MTTTLVKKGHRGALAGLARAREDIGGVTPQRRLHLIRRVGLPLEIANRIPMFVRGASSSWMLSVFRKQATTDARADSLYQVIEI